MRRSSIVGPLLLIVVGALFLMNNLRPELPLLEAAARYWPLVLIAWGALRLLEVLYWAATRKPLPDQGVSSGEWVLIVFLCLVGSGLFFFHHRIGGWPPTQIRMRGIEVFGESFDYPLEEKTVETGKAPRVVIENFRGNVRVTGSESAEVKVGGRNTVRALERAKADEANAAAVLEVSQQGDTVVIRTNQERVSSERQIRSDLEISVPKGSTLEARGRHGDFDISGIDGNVEITSDSAGVRVQDIQGDVRADLRSSDIIRATDIRGSVEFKGRGRTIELEDIAGQVTIDGAYSGELQFRNLAKPLRYQGPQADLRVEQVRGQLHLTRGYLNAENLVGPVQIEARSKDVQIRGFTNELTLSLDRGDIELSPGSVPLPRMEVQTRSGDIELALPPKASFDLKATAEKGEVQNDYGDPLEVQREDRGGTIRGSTGDGPVLVLSTGRGLLRIRKAGKVEPPIPPVPPMPSASNLELQRN